MPPPLHPDNKHNFDYCKKVEAMLIWQWSIFLPTFDLKQSALMTVFLHIFKKSILPNCHHDFISKLQNSQIFRRLFVRNTLPSCHFFCIFHNAIRSSIMPYLGHKCRKNFTIPFWISTYQQKIHIFHSKTSWLGLGLLLNFDCSCALTASEPKCARVLSKIYGHPPNQEILERENLFLVLKMHAFLS